MHHMHDSVASRMGAVDEPFTRRLSHAQGAWGLRVGCLPAAGISGQGAGCVDKVAPASQRERMPYYRAVGEIPRKRHTQFRKLDGSLYAEELMGVEGFSSDSALLYHQHLPTAILDAVAVDEPTHTLVANHPLKPR